MTATPIVRSRSLSLGTATTLPATLANDRISLRFVTHGTYGVTLDTVTRIAGGFSWTNAQASDDGTVTGQMWRLGMDAGNEHNAEHNAEHGAGIVAVDPDASVAVYSGEDAEGRPALAFRWAAIALPNGGTVAVTAVVALGADEDVARWSIHVDRSGTAADAIEHIAYPIISVLGPVPARSGGTHADAQVRTQVLLQTRGIPDVGTNNAALLEWDGVSLTTQHPAGYSIVETQVYQFEALCAQDPNDLASRDEILFLGTNDQRMERKQFVRAGVRSGDSLIYAWEHRYFPPWASVPILSTDATTRFGNVSHARYEALVGCLAAKTAAWWADAAAFYREAVADRMASPPKLHDSGRSALAKGAPLVAAVGQDPNLSGRVLANILTEWTEDHANTLGADVTYAQWNQLKPTFTQPAPTMNFEQLRGCNYLPFASTSHCLHLAWVSLANPTAGRPTKPTSVSSGGDGFFWASHLRDELNVLQGVGFNTIRLWGSFLGYLVNPTQYIANLKVIAQECNSRGIGISYVLFNQVPAGFATAGGSALSIASGVGYSPNAILYSLWTLSDAWQSLGLGAGTPQNMPSGEQDLNHWPEPMTEAEWAAAGRYGEWSNTTFQGLVGQYVRAIADFFANDADGMTAYRSTDLYNEVNLAFGNATAKAALLDFMTKVAAVMAEIQPAFCPTIGWAGNPQQFIEEMSLLGFVPAYSSSHAYAYTATDNEFQTIGGIFAGTATQAATGPSGASIPSVMTEFYVVPENSGQMSRYFSALAGHGGQSWCYIQNNAYRNGVQSGTWDYHGFAYPFDGLVTCTKPMLSILTTDTLTFENAGGEHNDEHNDEHNMSPGMQADRAAVAAWCAEVP